MKKDDIEFVTEFPCLLGHPVKWIIYIIWHVLYLKGSVQPHGVLYSFCVQICTGVPGTSTFILYSVHGARAIVNSVPCTLFLQFY